MTGKLTGGVTGFWHDTVGSLIAGTLYDAVPPTLPATVLYVWVAGIIVALPVALTILARAERGRRHPLATLTTLVTLVAMASIVQHWLLGVAYLQGRRALFLTPLFLVCAFGLLQLRQLKVRGVRIAVVTLVWLPATLLLVHSVSVMNLTRTLDWQYDAGTKDLMRKVADVARASPMQRPLHLRANWELAPSANFYRRMLGIEADVLPVDRTGLDGPADLYLAFAEGVPVAQKHGAEAMFHAKNANTWLLARRTP